MADRATISALATAGGTLVLAVATFASLRWQGAIRDPSDGEVRNARRP